MAALPRDVRRYEVIISCFVKELDMFLTPLMLLFATASNATLLSSSK